MLTLPQNSTLATSLSARLEAVLARIAAAVARAGRTADSVTLIAVSKGHTPESIAAVVHRGVRHCGESYPQEALPKITALQDAGIEWHFLGRLQANKTRSVAENFTWVHGLDRLRIAERLSQQRPPRLSPLNICLQVNIAHDDSKAGVTAGEAAELAAAVALLPRLKLRGLMCMLPEELTSSARQAAYGQLRELGESLRVAHPGLDTLSMGMSADLEDAIAAGATMVRVGTAIFGPRPRAIP